MSDVETAELIRSTEALIASRPVEILLNRPGAFVSDGAGGKVRSGATTQHSSTRCFFADVTAEEAFAVNDIGERVIGQHVIVASHEADIRQGDWFMLNDMKYVVARVHHPKTYQVKASVVSVA